MSAPASTNEIAEPDLSGRTLGDYRLDYRLGRGGMAVVYLAHQVSLGRPVALKVLRAGLARDASYVRRFVNEAQAAAKLVHANIVQIHEVGCIEGVHFIAQEYVPGQNLKQMLSQRPDGVPVAQALQIMRQVALALQKSVEQQITHRDIKPENIMLTDAGEVKVADFGLARIATGGDALHLTQVGITMGTPLYMSPEQVEGKDVGATSDLYSLGVTCYEMLTGRPPFTGDSALAIAVQHLKTEPPRLENAPRLRDFPAVCRLVHKLLAKNPAERYALPRDLLAELRTLKVEGLEDDWAANMQTWAVSGPGGANSSRFAATQQLDQILKSQAMPTLKRTAGWQIAALLVVALVVGGLAARLFKPKGLLAYSPTDLPQVAKVETAEMQWLQARMTNNNIEQAFLAVEKYFPAKESANNARHANLAKRDLAAWYVGEGQTDKALKLYHQLADLGETETEFRTTGLAGEALIYDRQKLPDQVTSRLPRILPNRSLLDDNLKEQMTILEKKYLSGAGKTKNK